jgi:hypothetical protein
MDEQTPFVVEDRWIVYARTTMEATVKYRAECDPNRWPMVRQATADDLSQLAPLVPAGYPQAA